MHNAGRETVRKLEVTISEQQFLDLGPKNVISALFYLPTSTTIIVSCVDTERMRGFQKLASSYDAQGIKFVANRHLLETKSRGSTPEAIASWILQAGQ